MQDNDSSEQTVDETAATDAAPVQQYNRHKKVKAKSSNTKKTESPAVTKETAPATDTHAADTHPRDTQETVGAADHTPKAAHPWYHETDVWIGVAFLLFILVAMKYIVPPITKGLDARSDKIRDQLEQANRLKAEAEALLDHYKTEQQKKLKEAEAMLEAARRDANALRARAAEDLKQSLARRTVQAEDRIARAEADAVAALRQKMVDAAMESARVSLVEKVTSEAADPALARAISAIETQLGTTDDAKPKRKLA